jgi:two-component system chemotaxis sensor kinase CheA
MDRKDEEFRKRLLLTFKVEAQEHLTAMTSGLIEIEKGDPRRESETIETVFRALHNLKGAARSVNLADVVAICQAAENVLSALKRTELIPSSPMLDLLHKAVAFIGKLVGEEGLTASEKSGVRELIRGLEGEIEKPAPVSGLANEPARRLPAAPGPSPAHTATIRISVAKLDALLLQVEEMLLVKLAMAQRVLDLKQVKKRFDLWQKERAKRSYRAKGRQEIKGEVRSKDGIDSSIAPFEAALTRVLKAAESDQRSCSVMVDALLADTKKALMLPFLSLLEGFPGLVRNLSREAGKETAFIIQGEQIEIDRRILEEIKDPLIHLVRNCIDHGIELPEERLKKKKPPRGEIKIIVSSRDGMIEIAVFDDGAGIDTSKMKAVAEKSGFLSQEEAGRLSDGESLLLAFRSGITTSPMVTDLSGRGLGLAIVKEKVEKLNGRIEIESQPGAGTTLRMILPLTRATFRGVVVRVNRQPFVLPSANIRRVARVKKEEIRTIGTRESLTLDGRAVSLVRLGEVLRVPTGDNRSEADTPFEQVVVLGSDELQMAFLVDEILHEQEVLVKPLGRQLLRVRNFSGATILGSGKVVPILNVSDLMKSAVKTSSTYAGAPAEEPKKRISILVAEDSITARTLLRTILESAGYDVKVAVDGVDAFTRLSAEEFDLLVSDVDMPGMNGFDLTAKVRADKKLSELPVVLVTALESGEDKKRGIDVGANAYIVKSSFDQSNLLKAVKRLI